MSVPKRLPLLGLILILLSEYILQMSVLPRSRMQLSLTAVGISNQTEDECSATELTEAGTWAHADFLKSPLRSTYLIRDLMLVFY